MKKAFTLAEVLITLGIIGVVAAMTIPTLIANTRSQQYRTKFKKTISTLSQAAKMSQAQYGYDYSGITGACGNNAQNQHPETTQSMCALLNGTLTGMTFYNRASDIKMVQKGVAKPYTFTSKYSSDRGFTPSTMHAYTLQDGAIIMFSVQMGAGWECTLPVGEVLKDSYSGTDKMRFCYGVIDVNGSSLPNQEVSCSSGSNSLSQQTCVVKNDAKHMTDIFPVRFHDGTVEPVTAAGRYVLRTAK